MNCEYCGKEESLPFVCNYCGGVFCGEHRLPEAHQCKGDLSQRRTITAPPQTTFTWQTQEPVNPFPTTRQTSVFSGIEIRDIVVAWLALAVAFTISYWSRVSLFGGSYLGSYGVEYFFVLSLFTIGPGFVLHELSHKFVAQRYGFWAEFRMWPMGLLLALATSLLGFIFAAPGATYISGMNISKEENGKISLAGPMVNVVIALIFLPFAIFGTGFWADLGGYGTYINIFLALFNLLPIGPLDGAKVFGWNKILWAIAFVGLAGTFYWLFFA